MELYIVIAALIIAGAAYLVFAETDPDIPETASRSNQIAANICEVLESPLWRQLFLGVISNRLLLTTLSIGAGALLAWLQNEVFYAEIGAIVSGFGMCLTVFNYFVSRPTRRRR